jgi:hypothetical protein
VADDRSVILEAYGELHPLDPPLRLCSFGLSPGTPSYRPLDGPIKSIAPWVGSSLLILDLLPLRFSVTTLGMMRRRRDMSEPSHDFRTSCAFLLVQEALTQVHF